MPLDLLSCSCNTTEACDYVIIGKISDICVIHAVQLLSNSTAFFQIVQLSLLQSRFLNNVMLFFFVILLRHTFNYSKIMWFSLSQLQMKMAFDCFAFVIYKKSWISFMHKMSQIFPNQENTRLYLLFGEPNIVLGI